MADNLFFIAPKSSIPHILNVLSNIAPYSGKVESIGRQCEIFDINMFVGRRCHTTGRLDFEPVVRIKGPPLSVVSSHPAALHVSWPIAFLNRLWLRSSSVEIFRKARDAFLDRLTAHYWPEFLLAHFRESSNFTRPCQASDLQARSRIVSHSQSQMWHSFPYHPVLAAGGFTAAFNAYVANVDNRQLLCGALRTESLPALRAGWRITAPRHWSKIKGVSIVSRAFLGWLVVGINSASLLSCGGALFYLVSKRLMRMILFHISTRP